MEAALGSASWLLGLVLNKLSEDLVNGYMSSAELGVNLAKIRKEMLYTKGLLEAAQGRDLAGNSGLKGLLEDLSKKADEAEDALDELHYFMIQDKLDGTQEAALELGDGLVAQAQHARHAARHTSGNWLSCFSCCHSQDDAVAAAHNTHSTSNAMDLDGDHVGNLPFDRVEMSKKIKLLIEELHSNCTPVSDLLKIVSGSNPQTHIPASIKRSDTSSEITQKKLFGRDAIFEKTIEEIISATQSGKTLSVLPIVGPGGIGKTTFTQHLYSNTRIEANFSVRVWICVSTNFDLLKLTKEIWSCLPPTENETNKITNETTNLDLLQKSISERLKSKRFLIVLDDIRKCNSTDEWEKLIAPFGKDETSGNMILVTTRFPKIVEMVRKETNPIELPGLDPDEFWKFFQICAFGRIHDEHDEQELIGIAKEIADKLKCSPLAAKTVGRLLIKKPCQEHWMKILKNKEWLKQNHDSNDIIPALKISYDYLPFHLKKCFSSFALFPEDYKFDKFEIVRFWDSVGIIDSSRQNEKVEDTGSIFLEELLDNGFLMKGDDNCYVMHDLLHDLSRSVSSEECAYICSSSFEANNIPQSIRYLSIFMNDHCAPNFEEEMGKLKRRVEIKNLRSLMIFGEYSRLHLVNILRETFNEIKGLRVLSIFMNSHNSLPHNFPKLVWSPKSVFAKLVWSLESVTIENCDKLFSRWSIGGGAAQAQSIINPLPPCLKKLRLWDQQSTLPMALLANLTSFTSLKLCNCKDITLDGFNPLITLNLEHLNVYNWRYFEAEPYSVAAYLLAAVATIKTMPAGSFQLVKLEVDSISAVLVAPICSRLSATLHKLWFGYDWRTENFTEEQDEALQLLTSLQSLGLENCRALQSLPQGLQCLPSLQALRIWGTQKIRSLPKKGLPDSLRELFIDNCCAEFYEECQKLKGIRPDIDIDACIAYYGN